MLFNHKKLHYVKQVITDFACLLFATSQVEYSGFMRTC